METNSSYDREENSVISWALKYLKTGFSVIPVGADKKPLIDWKPYQEKRADEKQLREWFDKPNPPNIAIVTGKISRITVVDVEKGGDWLKFPTTMTVATGGGGYHLYYKYAEGMTNKARIMPLTDIRGDGGYVLAVPSKTTGEYKWQRKENCQPFPYTLFGTTPTEKTEWKDLLAGVSAGSRNQSTAKVVGKILNSINPLDWNTVAWEMVLVWNGRNSPPLSDKELRTTFNSIVGTRIRTGAVKLESEEETNDIRRISEIAKDLTDDMKVSYPTGFEVLDKAFMGGLKEGDLFFITGYTGMGKSTFSQSMSYNLALAGHPVLWFSFEMPIGELWRKFKDMGAEDNFEGYAPEKNTNQKIDWVHEKIIQSRDAFKTKIVFIDHLGFLSQEPKNYDMNLSNNHATVLTMIVRRLKTLAMQENIAIVLMGHLRKPANGFSHDPTVHDIKDSAGVGQESDGVIIVNRERADKNEEDVFKNGSHVKIEKNRRTGATKSFKVIMVNGKLMDDHDFGAFSDPAKMPIKNNKPNY